MKNYNQGGTIVRDQMKNIIGLSTFLLSVVICYNSTHCMLSHHKPDIIKFIKKYLPSNPIIIEAGAFDGTDSKIMADLIPGAIIHSFEPDPENYLKMQKNVKNKPNIFCYPLALSDTVGILQFYRSNNINKEDDRQSGALLAPKEHLSLFPHIVFDEIVEVFATTLDKWAQSYGISNVDFLWLDLQGVELNVLKAAPNVLKKVKVIFTEVELKELYAGQYLYADVKKWLEGQGFTIVAKDFDEKNVSRSYGNILLIRK